MTYTFADIFAGIGGFRKGFESPGGQCVFTCELDEYARQTYRANYKCDHAIAGDITKVQVEDIPKHDLLLAGFPCQPFSIAGVTKRNSLNRQHGFRCDTQGTLFFDVARIIEYHRPKVFILENVKNLVNHDSGRTFEIINHVLVNELNYRIHWKVVNADLWVPQHRERIFIVGFRDRNNFDFNNLIYPDYRHSPKLGSILHPENGLESVEPPYTYGPLAQVLPMYTLSDGLWKYLRDYKDNHCKKGNGFGFGLFGPSDVTRTLSARYHKDGSEILIKQDQRNPRRLTPRECSRLMGFDNVGESKFIIPVSNTRAYIQFGNAVVVPVVQAIAQLVIKYLV